MSAVVQHILVGLIACIDLVHPIGLNEVKERLPLNVKGGDGVLKGEESRFGRRAGVALPQLCRPVVQQGEAVSLCLVAKVVNAAAVCVDGGDVGEHVARHQA